MAQFTNFLPSVNQTDVPRTTIVNFTILTDGYGGAQIGTLAAKVDGYQAILGGAFVNGYNGSIFAATGKYVVGIYPKAPKFFRSAADIKVQLQVLDSYSSLDSYNYNFFTTGYGAAPGPTIPTPPTDPRACDPTKPFFPSTDLGLRVARDSGNGTEVELEWKQAYPSNEDNVVFYNLFFSTKRLDVFTTPPLFLVATNEATIGGLPPGDTHFFGLRATEVDPNAFTLSGLSQAGPDLYFHPVSALDSYVDQYNLLIPADTEGFPTKGTIHVGTELINYGSLQSVPPGFIVTSSGRGFAGSTAESHSADAAIRLYRGKEDNNTIIVQATPTFQKPNNALTWVLGDGYGADGYRDGYDGYDAYNNATTGATSFFDGYDGYFRFREEPFDSITTDGTNNDESGSFNRFDYCGTYRTRSPSSFMKGQCTNTYWGGVQLRDGYRVRVPDVRTHMLQREELMLESTGEPFVLLRRLWTGVRCACAMLRREHADARCPICYGTSFTQGYVQFFNTRRSDRRILVRVDPAADDLSIIDRGGLEPMYEPSAWTMPFPAIKDRDVLIRFNTNNTEEFRYEVLDVTRVRSFFAQTGAQKFRLKRFPKTDIIYQYPAARDVSPTPNTIITSTGSGPGMPVHTHQIIIPEGADLTTIRTATLVSEGHNHVIFNGLVQPVLGHTHTIII